MSDSTTGEGRTGLEIAVVGMAGRFPGARDVEQFWLNLRDGAESITRFTDEELRAAGVPEEELADPNYVGARGVLEGAEMFDAAFFGYNPREAEILDPQQRVFLECAWAALEAAGYDPAAYRKRVGVYAGVGMNTYAFNLLSHPELIRAVGHFQLMTSNDKDYLPTRVSYKLNLTGPSVNVQTACSTSLVAVHLACQGLLSGECDTALAGGVSIAFPQTAGYFYQPEGIASPDGHCRAFDERAQGTVGAHGVGVVVLKRLEDAVADGDHIHAVVKGSAINNDGARKVGYTAPSVEGQAQVIQEAQTVAGVAAETIRYVEAHGTATPLGDPIEVAALTKAFGSVAAARRSCALGSLKTNVGHLDAAAGVAGLIKAALSLEREMIPPSLHFERPNPRINFDEGPFFVNDQLTPWPRGSRPRRAGVSSFGIGGTNAHVVVEEAPARGPSGGGRPWQLLTLSAKTEAALEEATANLAAHLGRNPEVNLADVAYTCAVGRRAFERRRAVVCRDAVDAVEALTRRDARRVTSGQRAPGEPRVAFMFPGQGAQHPSMGAELYRLEPFFRERVDECCEILRPHLGLDLRDLLFAGVDESDASARKLAETALAQPALFVTEYALARLWMSWGVAPDSMIGHSVGEYVAACLGGVFTLEEALPLVAARGRLMQAMPAGSMLAAQLPEDELRALLDAEPFAGRLSLAAVNAPSSCVVSGRDELLSSLGAELARRGLDCRRLDTSHAFHSEMMEPVLAPFAELVGRVRLKAPALPFISNLTGRRIADHEATDPTYWARHLRQTVRFADGVGELLKEPELILLEVGPGRALGALARQHGAKTAGHIFVSTLPHAAERASEMAHVLGALGKLWVAGKGFDAGGLYAGERRRRVPLPTYPFERRPYWVDARRGGASDDDAPKTAEKREEIADWFYLPAWKQSPPPGSFVPEGGGADDTAALTRAGSGRCRLVFVEETGLGQELARRFSGRGEEVVTVEAGERFRRLGEGAYEIDPRGRRGYEDLISELRRDGKSPRAVVHLWALTASERPSAGAPVEESDFEREQWRGYYSLLHLAQALAAGGRGGEVEVCVVSNGLHAVHGGETVRPEKATLLGPCRVIPQEYANVSCRSIDVETPESWTEQAREGLAAQLVAEIDAGGGADKVVAYRGSRRWVQTFDAVRLGGTATTSAGDAASAGEPLVPARLRERGVYIVTGGGGGVGMELASYLARACRARLVLLGRGEPGAEKVAELERLGGEVMWARADVSDEGAVGGALEEARRRFGPINGLVHAAGLAGDAAVVAVGETGREESERQFRAKVYGLLKIERALRESELDFCLLVSSLSSVLGGLGFAAYAAANLFMDAFAHRLDRAGGARWVSVNWDGWHFGGEGGEGDGQGRAPAILPAEGAEAFGRILRTRGLPQVVVSASDLRARIERWVELAGRRAGADDAPALYARPELANDYEPPRDAAERAIADIWQQLLGIEGVGVNDNFFDLGGHSLLATQLVSRIRDTFQVEVSLRSFFEAPTVAGLAALVGEGAERAEGEELERLLEEIESLSSAEVDASLSREGQR